MENILKFDDIMDQSLSGLVLVDFWSPTCGPCKLLKEELVFVREKVSIPIYEINIMEHIELAVAQKVMGVPSLRLYHKGEIVAEKSSFVPERSIRKWIDRVQNSIDNLEEE